MSEGSQVPGRRGPRGLGWAGVLLAGAGLLVAGCTGAGSSAAGQHHAAGRAPLAKVTITTGNLSFGSTSTVAEVRPAAGLIDRRPDLGITVTVAGGRLIGVMASSDANKVVPGNLSPNAMIWHTDWALSLGRSYRVTATAVNSRGQRTVTDASFATLSSARIFSASTTLGPGQNYGVGMPIMISFSHAITDKAEVERALLITSSKPVTGAWYWMSDTEVWFRPETYWPQDTDVTFEAHLKGVRGAPGVYGDANLTSHFRIGESLVAIASAATHYMKVWWKGHLVGRWPISTGRPGMDTPDGHYLSFAMANPVDMNSASYGVMPGNPNYYNELVYDAVQFTYSGDYVHSAPWSVGEQGFVNVSHGCVNVAPANAAWYYARSMLGDPVTVEGSPVPGTWGDGWTVYFLSWRKLLEGSATHEAVQAGPHGSQFEPAAAASTGVPPSAHVH